MQRGLIAEGKGEIPADALYDLLSNLYVVPVSENIFLRLFSFIKLTFKGVPFKATKRILFRDKRSDGEKKVMRIAHQATFSTAEIIKCVEADKTHFANDEEILDTIYHDEHTTSENIAYSVKSSPACRPVLNDVLYLIDAGLTEDVNISREDIYNAYTGDGGLHGLKRSDYDSYADYSDAKKEIENGQFFTPPSICQTVAQCISVGKGDLIADLTCGIGNFFNFMPTENNLYGCEIDNKAYKVARHLYPDANIENGDIRLYKPGILFDYVLGNPPFNLKWWIEGNEEVLSQLYYCIKAHELLKPCGIMAIVVPKSFLADDFTDGSMIREMNERFRFLGQFDLPVGAFAPMGVESFPTKLQFWQKRKDTEDTEMPYYTACSFTLPIDLADNIARAKVELSESRMELLKATAHNTELTSLPQYIFAAISS